MIGRVARNVHGKAILYAATMTPAMKQALDETNSRRKRQIAYNQENHITPTSSVRRLAAEADEEARAFTHSVEFCKNLAELCHRITEEEQQLLAAADAGDENHLEKIRQQLDGLYRQFIYV